MDFGSGAFARLSKYIKPCDLDFMFLSHTHDDHTCDLGVMTYYLARLGKRMRIYMPKPQTQFEMQRFANYTMFDYVYIDEQTPIKIQDINLTFYQMRHPVLNYAIRIEQGKNVLSYTGDTNTTDNIQNLLKGATVGLMDGCFLERDWGYNKPHLSGAMATKECAQAGAYCLITHLDANYNLNELLQECKSVNTKVEIVTEEKVYIIEDGEKKD